MPLRAAVLGMCAAIGFVAEPSEPTRPRDPPPLVSWARPERVCVCVCVRSCVRVSVALARLCLSAPLLAFVSELLSVPQSVLH